MCFIRFCTSSSSFPTANNAASATGVGKTRTQMASTEASHPSRLALAVKFSHASRRSRAWLLRRSMQTYFCRLGVRPPLCDHRRLQIWLRLRLRELDRQRLVIILDFHFLHVSILRKRHLLPKAVRRCRLGRGIFLGGLGRCLILDKLLLRILFQSRSRSSGGDDERLMSNEFDLDVLLLYVRRVNDDFVSRVRCLEVWEVAEPSE
mmetsp:Transcript_5028/g.12135  ORF Transcript_5028/g.12135 Transcript_5028/m.12135 type:complete len:206 (+) Transcript_5028:537-1154(+)